MKLPDVNLLLYAYDARSPHHLTSKAWLEDVLSSDEPIAFAWPVLIGFIRLTTRPQIYEHPFTPSEAFEIIARWLAQPNAFILHPAQQHLSNLRGLLEAVGTAGNLTSDAHLAALAIEYGAELCSADSDFGRFQGLRWTNPLTN